MGLLIVEVGDDALGDGESVLVVLGEVVGHTGRAAVEGGTTELLLGDNLENEEESHTRWEKGESTSPVAALTRGGPPRKMVPVPVTMTASSAMQGT